MPKFTFTISEENEEWLRKQHYKKGDFSKLINEALEKLRKGQHIEDVIKKFKRAILLRRENALAKRGSWRAKEGLYGCVSVLSYLLGQRDEIPHGLEVELEQLEKQGEK